MTVTRDSVGTSAVSTGAALSFAGPVITTPGMGTVVLVAVIQSVATNGTSFGATVTYDGAAMTAVGAFTQLGSTTSRSGIGWFWMYHPPAGSKTIVVTPTGTTAKTRQAAFAQAYRGVDFATGPANLGLTKTTAASLTLSAPSYAGGITVAATVNGAALSAPTQTQLYNNNVSVGGVGDTLLVQEAAGTGSNISFSSTGTATTPQTESVRLPAAPLVSAFTDDFDDNTDIGWINAHASYPVTYNGQASWLSPASSAASGLSSPNGYYMIGSAVSIQMVQVTGGFPSPGGTLDSYPLFIELGFNTGYELGWVYGGATGNLWWFWANGAGRNFDTGRTYDPATHKFFRIRESGGSIFYDTSADGSNWTNQGSVANPFQPTAMRINSWGVTGLGVDTTVPMIVDNYNLAPPIAKSLPAPTRRPNYGSLLQL
jgi:hypothetical protein